MVSLKFSVVSRWPEGACKLRKLKLLDLSESGWDEIIPPKVIGSMHQLEDLLMRSGFVEIKDDSLSELESLTRMTSLELNIECTGKDTLLPNLEKLTSFKLFVFGRELKAMLIDRTKDWFQITERALFQRIMFLSIPSGSIPNWVLVLMAKTEYLFLNYGGCIGSVEELDGKGFTVLKDLQIESCAGVKFLMGVNVVEMTPKSAFSSLERLTISRLSCFEAFYRGVIPGEFFSKLRVLQVSDCERLISLVPANLLVRLQNLESLTVDSCPSLKELIQFEEGEENRNFPSSPIFPNLKDLTIVCCTKLKIIFGGDSNEGSTSTAKNKLLLPKLRRLFLMNLPQLSTISLPSLMVDCPSLEKFHVTKCLHLKKLPFDTASVPNLKALEASGFWFNSLEWDDEDTKSLLKKALVFK